MITLANQEGATIGETDYYVATDELSTIEDNQMRITIADLGYTSIFIIFLVYFEWYQNKVVKQRSLNAVTPGAYAVEVKRLPKEPLTADEVKAHFSQFGEVVDVHFAKNFGGRLQLYKERANISINLGFEKLVNKDSAKVKKFQKKLAKFDKKILNKERGEASKSYDELPVNRAYVIFNKADDKKKCLNAYANAYTDCCRRRMKRNLMFRDKYKLFVKQTIEPSNIIWENVEYSHCKRVFRRMLAACITLILMIASIALIYAIKYLQNKLPTDDSCTGLGINKNTTFDQANDFEDSDQVYCFCKLQDWYKLTTDSDYRNLCDTYIQKVSTTGAVRFLASIGIVFVNIMLRIIITLLTQFERISTVTKTRLSVMTKVFIAMFVNTALITLFVNADFQSLWFVQRLAFKDYLFNGKYNDFSREWYQDVGATITATLLVSIAFPHFINLLFWYPVGLIKRSCCLKRHITQHQLNTVFTGPEFDISSRTSLVLTSIFSCFLYSGGMPMLNMVCFCILFVIYWTDKFLILRHYRKPPVYSEMIYKRLGYYLPFCVIFHCGFSLYAYGSQSIFPTEYREDELGIVDDVKTETIIDRIGTFPGRVNIILSGLAVLLFLWTFILKGVYNSARRHRIYEETTVQKTYMEELKTMRALGIHNYDIMENPGYRVLIISMNSTAVRSKASGVNNTAAIISNEEIGPMGSY